MNFPHDPAIGGQSRQALDWMITQLNQLIGQSSTPPNAGLASLNPNSINPSSSQVSSVGSRMFSVTTPLAQVAGTTLITFYWDGSNGSVPFQIYRDDGTRLGPLIQGSPFAVTGLTANTKYFFYFYWDEAVNQIKAVSVPGVSLGVPAVAFTAQNLVAAQQQFLRGRIPLANTYVSTGVSTTVAGTANGSGGSGGGSGGGALRYQP